MGRYVGFKILHCSGSPRLNENTTQLQSTNVIVPCKATHSFHCTCIFIYYGSTVNVEYLGLGANANVECTCTRLAGVDCKQRLSVPKFLGMVPNLRIKT